MKDINSEVKILLWGPPNSGKTWFLNSFTRSVSLCDLYDDRFKYDLGEYSGGLLTDQLHISSPFEIGDKHIPRDHTWLFSRSPKQNTYNAKISAYSHLLHLIDYPGDMIFNFSEDTSTLIKDVDEIIVFLDPTLTKDYHSKIAVSKNDEIYFNDDLIDEEFKLNKSGSQKLISVTEYQAQVQKLFDFLIHWGREETLIIFCVTKADEWLSKFKGNISDSIQHFFGENIYRFIQTYRKKFNIHIYINSAVGFLDEDKKESNFNISSNKMINSNIWDPINSELPVFWLLEKIELDRLKRKKALVDQIFGDQKVKSYLPYFKIDRGGYYAE